MLIQIIREYIQYSKEDKVKKMNCSYTDHGLLYPNIDFNDNIYLYCLCCDYKKYLGKDTYDGMLAAVEIIRAAPPP